MSTVPQLLARSAVAALLCCAACVGDAPSVNDGGGGDGGGADAAEKCGSGTCAELPPVGWTGPVAVYLGNPAGAPSCAGEWPQEKLTANADLVAPPAQCTACTCQPAANPTCDATVTARWGASCGSLCGSSKTIPVAQNGCAAYDSDVCGGAHMITGVTVAGTASPCVAVPASPQATVQPTKWNAKAVACGAPALAQNGCSVGKVCATTPPQPLSSKLCVYKTGDASCPAGSYAQKTLVFTGAVSDTRGCGNCACGSPMVDCAGTLTVHTNNTTATCTDPVTASMSVPTANCGPAGSGNQKYAVKYVRTGAQAACPPQGGQPTGTATAADPTTLCCSP